ncbi:tetratricopeptide repeat-containing sulfotransferase family protein [Salipiger sp.]|uniref:tetratricopeptide repeat-containing sulfotransferase family protein n=1 Tax=Salipiger sp. TaxID=2078585 RepID=UPI003A96D415
MLPLSDQQKSTLAHQVRTSLARGDWTTARSGLEQLFRSEPKRADLAFQLSRVAFEAGDRAACLSWMDKAVALAPSNGKLTLAAAERFRQLGADEAALRAYDLAIASDRKALKPRADKAHYLQLLGRFEESDSQFRKLISQHPEEAELYRIFLATKKPGPGDPLLSAMERLWDSPRLTDPRRVHLAYALAKAMEETGRTDRVFAFLRRANELQRRAAPFDSAAQEREFAGVLAAQDGLPTEPLGAPLAIRPVFVTGMPRSGTTLVERILAAHGDVTAGGEIGHAMRLAYQMFGVGEAMRPLAAEPEARLRRFAERYATLVTRDLGPKTPVITDKSILCHLIFGLLNRTLPGARIIVVLRDPRDIALSIYKNHFTTGSHRYANDLADIAVAIKRFRRNVAHWKSRLPGVIHEIRYEDLVTEPEAQSRALVAAAGLGWQDACLDFHSAGGAVKTLSVSQVRQPIYRGSAEAWRKYETELEPFIAAWGTDPWD